MLHSCFLHDAECDLLAIAKFLIRLPWPIPVFCQTHRCLFKAFFSLFSLVLADSAGSPSVFELTKIVLSHRIISCGFVFL